MAHRSIRRLALFMKHSHIIFIRKVSTVSTLATAFNALPSRLADINLLQQRVGLFGIPQLEAPDGFYLLKEDALHKSDQLIEECCSPKRKRKMVEVFDHLSNTLCKVADLSEFVRLSHPDHSFSVAAEDACVAIGGLVEKLNTHKDLYNALNDVVQNGDIVPTDEVDEHVTKLFLFDFEQSGIHLDEKKRTRVACLNEHILTLGQKFLSSTSDPREVKKEKLPPGISHHFASDGDSVIVSGMLSDSPNERVREVAYKIFLSPEEVQEHRFLKLINLRHEMALLCGFPSYSHRAVKGSLAEMPELVNSFLCDLTKELKSEANIEFDEMRTLKKLYTKGSSKPLSPWDVPFFTRVARNKVRSVASESISSYFSLGTVMEGLSSLYKDVFNISLHVVTPEPGELWTKNIYKLEVIKDSSELLGFIYCDFFEHPRKMTQDCHFTIRGGKVLQDGSYQNPVVVLHLNFPLPTWSTPCLLTLSMVENLFHEMGHALHSMIGRTQYQHVTGTRCSTDFAEVPSLLMEFFANDARVLHRIAKHYATGEKLPLATIEEIISSSYAFSVVETQLQTFYSHLDQKYHGIERWSPSISTTQILEDTQNATYGLPYIPNTAWHLRFGHLVGYGAKYYSYLMSRAVASWIWHKYFKKDPFSRDAGEKLSGEVLSHGGGKPPLSMVAEYLEKKVASEDLVSALMTDLHSRRERFLAISR